MPYTQAQLDDARSKLASAKSSLDSAKASMDSWYNAAMQCKYDGTLILGETSDVDCKKRYNCNTSCCSKETCRSNMASYNASVLNWDTATNNYEDAKENVDTILSDLEEESVIEDPIGNGTGTDIPDDVKSDEQARTKQIIFFVIVAVVIFGAAFLLTRKSVVTT